MRTSSPGRMLYANLVPIACDLQRMAVSTDDRSGVIHWVVYVTHDSKFSWKVIGPHTFLTTISRHKVVIKGQYRTGVGVGTHMGCSSRPEPHEVLWLGPPK